MKYRIKSSDDQMMSSSSDCKYWSLALCVTCVKVLLMKSYSSTDFEVHRNWLSITHNLPLSQWYYESTSEWTLDYPPLFAWFELLLSQFAPYFDENMLKISSKGYISDNTIIFQRLTVIISDFVFFYAVLQWSQIITKLKTRFVKQYIYDQWFHPNVVLSMLFLWNPGLLLVDHIHFQYNGLLSGILLLSMARIMQKREIEATLWFSVLLNMKHIYVYISPAFFVYLLRNYCFDRHLNFKIIKFAKLSLTVCLVFIASFGPFIILGQFGQLMSRLFPFRRGLSHAYWAPNFWAFYNTLDKVLSAFIRVSAKTNQTMTSGLVQQFEHQVLPNVAPVVTFTLVFVTILPSMSLLWRRSHQNYSQILFLRCVVMCAFSSYLFGWHVHEKAILLLTIPLTPLALVSKWDAKLFNLVSIVGNYSLFPLLYKEAETPTKILLLVIYSVYSLKSLEIHHKINVNKFEEKFILSFPLMNFFESIYLFGLLFVQMFYSFSHLSSFCLRYPFMPLMITSFYCSLGLIYCFIDLFKNLHSIKA